MTLALLAMAAWLWWTEPRLSPPDPQQSKLELEERLENSTAIDLWWKWQLDYSILADRGFDVYDTPRRDFWEGVAEQKRLYRNVALVLAGVVAVLSVGAFFLIRPAR